MFLPIGDEPNLRGTPVVNYALIGMNVAIFVLISIPLMMQRVDANNPAVLEYLRALSPDGTIVPSALPSVLSHMSAYDLFVFEHGFKPAAPSITDLFASMFLHANFFHVAGNMLFLWIYGDNVELHVGRAKYLAIYLLTGVTAVMLHAMFRQASNIPLIGASGAISGVLGCYFVWFPRNQVRILVVFLFFIQVIRLPARLVLGIYIILENLLPFLMTSSGTGVAYGAHIGGFLGGFGVAVAMNRLRDYQALAAGARRLGKIFEFDDSREEESSPSELFQQLVRSGQWPSALSFYSELPVRKQALLPAEEVLLLSDALSEQGQLSTALAILQRYIATHPMGEHLARAHLRAGVIHLREQRLPAARQHFLTALDVATDQDEEDAAHQGLSAVERRQGERQRQWFNS